MILLCLGCIVHLLLFFLGGARRNIRIDESHRGAQQQNNTFANSLELSTDSRGTFVPGILETGSSRRESSGVNSRQADEALRNPRARLPQLAEFPRQRIRRREAVHLPALAALVGSAGRAVAGGDRVTAQSVGIGQNVGVLADPRALLDGEGLQPLIWGARERCDPTLVSCKQGGVGEDSLLVQPVPSRRTLEVTDRVQFDMSVGGEGVGILELALWRQAAPQAVDALVKLCAGRFFPIDDEILQAKPASLERSVVVRVLKDRQVVLGGLKVQGGSMLLVRGRTKPQLVPVPPPVTTDAPNGISHDAAGLVSVVRGGGSFEFTLVSRANGALDKDNLVIGQITNADGMAILERINALPTDNYRKAPLATVRIERARVL